MEKLSTLSIYEIDRYFTNVQGMPYTIYSLPKVTMFSLDPFLTYTVILSLAAMLSTVAAYFFRAPSIITHLIAGVAIGPFALSLVDDREVIQHLGEFGIIFLLFFIGMEISLRSIALHWRIITLATLVHAGVSVGVVLWFGWLMDWSVGQSVLLGMVISLSSTAVLLRYFEEQKKLNTKIGQEVSGILIMQDLMAIPMLLVIVALSTNQGVESFVVQIVTLAGVVIVLLTLAYAVIVLARYAPVAHTVRLVAGNAEAGLFIGLSLCFGLALATATLGLSPGFGAFVAGVLFTNLNLPEKVRKRLVPFKIFFMALFFISIGLLVNIPFLLESWPIALFFVFTIFVFNTLIRSVYFRALGETWRYSIYGSSLLAHVGEFGFFIAAAGFGAGMITDFSYQLIIIMIATSLLLSPLWIRAFARFRPASVVEVS